MGCCFDSVAALSRIADSVAGYAKEEVYHLGRLRHFVRRVAQKQHDCFALRHRANIPRCIWSVVESEYPAYWRRLRGEIRVEFFGQDERLQGTSVAEQEWTGVGVRVPLVIDEGVLV